MIEGIHNAAEGMQVCLIQQELIANNLANLNTNGYKSGNVFLRLLESSGNAGQKLQEEQVFDFQQGALQNTGNTWDFALAGDGFFMVESAQGVRFTRNGSFHPDADGFLAASDGSYVLGENGPILASGAMSVNQNGELFENGRYVDTLRVVDFVRPYRLLKLSDSQYVLDDQTVESRSVEKGIVRQGFLEQSNVNAIREMVSMISVFRNFEAGSKALQMADETLGKAINEMGVLR